MGEKRDRSGKRVRPKTAVRGKRYMAPDLVRLLRDRVARAVPALAVDLSA